MELAHFRNDRESYDEDELFEAGRNPGWEPDSKIIMQLDLGLKITIFNTIFAFVNIVLLLQLYNSHPGAITKAFFTSTMLTLFLSGFSTLWVCHSAQRIQFSLRPNLMVTALIFFLSASLAVYFFGMFIRLMFYKDEHAAYLKGQLASAEVWRNLYGEHTYDEELKIQNSKLNWCIPSSFIFAIALSYIAIITRKIYLTFSMRSYGLNKLLLIICSLITVGVSWGLFSWANEANYISSTMLLGFNMKRPVLALMTTAFITIFLVTANTVLAVKKQRKSYLGFMILYVLLFVEVAIFTFALVTYVGQYHRRQATMMQNCKDVASTIHEDRLRSVCPFGDKYLAPGIKCGKSDLTIRWEAGLETHQIRTLNPACCQMSMYFYVNPHTNTAHFGVMLCILLVVLFLVNYSLWKNSNSLFYIFPKAWETIGAITLVGACIAFVIYLFFNPTKGNFEKDNKEMLSYQSPLMFQSNGFPLVPPDMSQKFKGKLCHQYRPDVYPFPTKSTTNVREKPVLRVALMAIAGYIKIYHEDVTSGATDASKLFFPGCDQMRSQQNLSSFKIIYGPTDKVREALSQAIYCTSESNKDQAKVFYDFSYWGPDELEKNGLTFQEDKKVIASIGQPETALASSCIPSNKHFFPAKFGSTTSLKGKLVYLDPDTNTESPVHPEIEVSVFEVLGKSMESPVKAANTVILEDSVFIVSDIIRLYDFSYTLRLKLSDPKDVFLNKSVDVFISPSESNVIELSAGKIRMVTADGKRCGLEDEVCKIKRLANNGVIKVGFSGAILQTRGHIGAHLLIYKDFILDSTPISNVTITTDSWNSTAIPFGSYTVVIIARGYLPVIERVDLQKSHPETLAANFIKSNGNHQMTITSTVLDDTIDFDLMVVLQGDSDRECTISPYNKYCAYAKMVPKSGTSSQARDGVMLKNMAVATYTAYVAPSPSYTKTCKSDMLLLSVGNGELQNDKIPSWDWDTVKAVKPLSSVPVLGYIKHNDDLTVSDPAFVAKLRTQIPIESPVETLEQSMKARNIRASFPRAVAKVSQLTPYLVNTDVRFSLKNKGNLDITKLRNWNPAATTALNSADEAWEAFNLTKLLNDSVLIGKTVWPEVENKTMQYMNWNNTTYPMNKEYDQNLPNGQKSHIIESNSTTPAGNGAIWIHQGKVFRNDTKYPNNTSLVSLHWWSAEIDPKDKRVLSNMSESSTDFNNTNGRKQYHKVYTGFHATDPNVTKQEVSEEDNDVQGNISKRTTISKVLDTDAKIKMVRRTVISCMENKNGTQLLSKSCKTKSHNSTKFSEYDEVQSALESPSKNETQLESSEKYKETNKVWLTRISESKVLDTKGILNHTTLSRIQEVDSVTKATSLLLNHVAEVIRDTKLGTVQAKIKDSSRRTNGTDTTRSMKEQLSTSSDGGSLSDVQVKFSEIKELEKKTIRITSKVDTQSHVSPLVEFNTTSKVIKNQDRARKVGLESATKLNETLTKLSGFKHNFTKFAETATMKTGTGSYVLDSKSYYFEAYQPMTNVSLESSNSTVTKKTSHMNNKLLTDYNKAETNLSRTLLPTIGVINQTVIEKLSATPWNKMETTVQATKICVEPSDSCSVEVKGQHQNVTANMKFSTAKLAMSTSFNSRGNMVFSQSLQLSHGNDTQRTAWDVHSLLDQITNPSNKALLQSTRVVDTTLRFPSTTTMEAETKNANLGFFGNTSYYRTHTSRVKTFSRKFVASQIKQSTNSTEVQIENSGKVGSENYINKVNYSNFLDVLIEGSQITNYTFVNYTEAKADRDTFWDIFNLTGASFKSRYSLEANITDRTPSLDKKTSSLNKRLVYSNLTDITGHQYITRWETTETSELSDTKALSRESRELRKSISYKENNHQTEVLTTYTVEKNKLNETNHFEFKVITNYIDLSKQASDASYRKQLSSFEKSFLILPSGKVQILKEHVFPEDFKKIEPVLPPVPRLLEPSEIPTIIPAEAQNFDVTMFEIKGANLSLVRNQSELGLRRNSRSSGAVGRRKLQTTALNAPSHFRTPRAAADARLNRLTRKLKLPIPTFSKSSVDKMYGVDRSRFFLIACFTGYGAPSVLQLSEYTVERPTPAECVKRLSNSQLKRYRVELLKRDIEEYKKGHQDYVDQLESIAEKIRDADSGDDLEISDFNVESF